MSTELTSPRHGSSTAMVHREMGVTEVHQQSVGSESAAAIQAREMAQVRARYAMAIEYPRKIEQVRVKLLEACSRPKFAETAMYARPVGREKNKKTGQWEEKIATGPSIRFIEEAMRTMGNILVDPQITYDSPSQRKIRVLATDLETNATWSDEVVIEKLVERKKLKEGQQAVGERINSQGDKVFIVVPGDDELQVKVAATVAKRARKLVERLIPSDIVEECMERVVKVQEDGDAKDPTAAKRKLIDAFAAIQIMPDDLSMYLEKSLDRLTPADFQRLRGVYALMKDGETSWEEIMLTKNPSGSVEAAQEVAKQKLAGLGKPTATTPVETKSTPVAAGPAGPKPKKISEADAAKLINLAENMGMTPEGLAKIITDHGFKSPYEITEGESWSSIYRTVEGSLETGARQPEDETQEAPQEQEQPPTPPAARRPQFGGKK